MTCPKNTWTQRDKFGFYLGGRPYSIWEQLFPFNSKKQPFWGYPKPGVSFGIFDTIGGIKLNFYTFFQRKVHFLPYQGYPKSLLKICWKTKCGRGYLGIRNRQNLSKFGIPPKKFWDTYIKKAPKMLKEIHRISIFRGGVYLELNGNNYSHIEYGRPP